MTRPAGATGAAAALRPQSGQTRTSELLGRLRADLLSGALEPGEPLRLAVLRTRYLAGLTPLREALFRLAAEGLVTVEDQRGFRVAKTSHEELADLTEQRVFLESRAIRLAIERGDLSWESRVLAANHLLTNTRKLEPGSDRLTVEWTDVHRGFHRTLLESCGSTWLLRFRDALSDQVERYQRWSIRKTPDRDVVREHTALTEAVLARDADLAVALLTAHYWRTAELCGLPAALLRAGQKGGHNAR